MQFNAMRANLFKLATEADNSEWEEGKRAYWQYHLTLDRIANCYGFGLPEVIAAFAALSPNNDYQGNLRSLVSVLQGAAEMRPPEEITVSTYKACRDRAYGYVTGRVDFLSTVKGPKITAFYKNILDPLDREPVTIDGHLVAASRSSTGTMKQNIPKRREYQEIAETVRDLASQFGLIPNQMQAIIWFARKRILNIKYDAQGDLFWQGNQWRTLQRVEDIRPFK